MSSDGNNNNNNSADPARQRRGSVGSSFASMFRSNSMSQGPTAFPGPISTAMSNDKSRRLSISAVGLGNSPTAAFNARRSSMSTNNSDSIDENAVEDDDGTSRTAPTTPFTRRMSFGAQAMRNIRGSGTSPNPNTDQGFNWSEQLRSRAESNVAAGSRPSFSFGSGMSSSPPRANSGGGVAPGHERAKSVSEMPAPPAQAPKPRPQKPDHMQERILKGDFYMD